MQENINRLLVRKLIFQVMISPVEFSTSGTVVKVK
jgi:hypothetical protein